MISRLLALAVLLMTFPALAQQPSHSAAMPGMAGGQSPADRAMIDGMNTMNQAMSNAPMTSDPDRDFVAMMIPHHQGAIDMAKVELQYGKDPAMRKLASAIVAAQQKEIAEMHRWQAKHPAR
jgi:uncharacterized protein (DUF305 family)